MPLKYDVEFNNCEKEIGRDLSDKVQYIAIFFTVFVLLNLTDLAITLHGLNLEHIGEFNNLLYISYFPVLKLALVSLSVTFFLGYLIEKSTVLAYFSSVGINTAYTLIVINNFVVINYAQWIHA